MYKLLGADQREYGPAALELVIQWISEGRVDANTKAQAEGSAEWKPLSSFPEFAPALSAKAARTPPPRAGVIDSKQFAAEVLARSPRIDTFRCVGRAWELVVNHFWLFVGAAAVLYVINYAAPILVGVTHGGLYLLALKLIRGQKAEFTDVFGGFSDLFLQLLLVGIVAGLLTAVGFFFCVIPGIYLAVAWLFAIPLVADKRLDFWPAMEVSLRVVNRDWWQFFLLVLLNVGLVILGLLACGVGVFVAIPVAMCAIAYAYEDIFSTPSPTPTHSV